MIIFSNTLSRLFKSVIIMKEFVEPREFGRMCVFCSGWVGVNEVEQLTLDATDEHSDLIFIPD